MMHNLFTTPAPVSGKETFSIKDGEILWGSTETVLESCDLIHFIHGLESRNTAIGELLAVGATLYGMQDRALSCSKDIHYLVCSILSDYKFTILPDYRLLTKNNTEFANDSISNAYYCRNTTNRIQYERAFAIVNAGFIMQHNRFGSQHELTTMVNLIEQALHMAKQYATHMYNKFELTWDIANRAATVVCITE